MVDMEVDMVEMPTMGKFVELRHHFYDVIFSKSMYLQNKKKVLLKIQFNCPIFISLMFLTHTATALEPHMVVHISHCTQPETWVRTFIKTKSGHFSSYQKRGNI